MSKTNFIKMTIVVFLIGSLNLLMGCGDDEKVVNNNSNDINKNELTLNEDNSSLLVIGDDRSGSTNANRKLTREEYEVIINDFIKNSCGVVAVRVIGNPKDDNLEFHRLQIAPCYKKIILDKSGDPTLTEIANNKKLNLEIENINDSIRNSNKEKLTAFLDKIEENVIKYKKAGKDLTDINDVFYHLETIVNETAFKMSKSITVVLLSDGVHDANKEKVKKLGFERPVRIQLVGWKDKSVFSTDQSEITSYESKEGLIEAAKNLFK